VKDDRLENILRTFKRQIFLANLLRLINLLVFLVLIIWIVQLPEPQSERMMFLVIAAAVLSWILVFINSLKNAREVRTASVLLNLGKLDDAEVWLHKTIQRFSLSVKDKILACNQLAALFMKRQAYSQAAAVCRVLLVQRLNRLRNVWVNARIMLADSLLFLNQIDEAYEAIRPLYDTSLSLTDRMKLLPVQLRYELAAGHHTSASQSLKEKVKIAELLDSPAAALVHALLAEACRRQAMTPQYNFLIERARLYHDLDELVGQFPVISALEQNILPSQDPTPGV